jgi:hypothetical protein
MREAKARSMPLTALIIERMDAPTQSAVPVIHRQIEELNQAGDAMREEIARKDAEIADLKEALAGKPKPLFSGPMPSPALVGVSRPMIEQCVTTDQPGLPRQKVVASVLPLAGTDFESRPVGSLLKGQTKGKGKA